MSPLRACEAAPIWAMPEGDAAPSPYDGSSVFSKAFFAWLTPFLKKNVDDAEQAWSPPPLPAGDETVKWAERMTEALKHQETKGRSHPWLRAYTVVFWDYLLVQTLYSVFNYLLDLLAVILTEKVLVFQEKQQHKDLDGEKVFGAAVRTGFEAMAAIILLGFVRLFLSVWYEFYKTRMNLRVNAALVGTVLARALRRPSHTAAPSHGTWTVQATSRGSGGGGAIFNLMIFDAGPSVSIIMTILGVWLWPYQIWTAMFLLHQRVQWAFLPGLLAMILIKLTSTGLLSYNGALRNRLLAYKDLRTARCSEAFTHIRTLQMLRWLEPVRERIMEARAQELAIVRRQMWLSKTNEGLGYVSGVLITLATFAYYTLHYGEMLKASTAFAAISLIGAVGGPLGSIPGYIQDFLVFRSAYCRINTFLAGGDGRDLGREVPDGAAVRLRGAAWHWPSSAAAGGGDTSKDDARKMPSKGVKPQSPLLMDGEVFQVGPLDLELKRGELLVVAGHGGAGKTSLLLGLLGEMPQRGGDVYCVAHPIPFAEQAPKLFSGSLRDNVVFGLRCDEAAYKRVLDACDLAPDVAAMVEGDATELGDGQTVSNGQRGRIALARALYCLLMFDAPLLLLDDPFAALDSQTSKHLCERILGPGGLASKAAVIICTSNPVVWETCAARVLVIEHGQSRPSTVQELSEFAVEKLDGRAEQDEAAQPMPHVELLQSPGGGAEESEFRGPARKWSEEARQHGSVQLKIYKKYGELAGWPLVVGIVVIIAGIMVCQQLCDVWFAFWTNDDPNKQFLYSLSGQPITASGWSNESYLRVYTQLVAGFIVFAFAGYWIEVYAAFVAARRLFGQALNVLQRPIAWWDLQPQGRVLNRFVSDVQVLDGCIAAMIGVVTGALLYFVGHTVFLSLTNPWCLLLVPPIALAFEYIAARYYRRSIREFQRLVLVSTSPLDHSAYELVYGQVTIRAFGGQRHALHSALTSLDLLQRAVFLKQVTGTWLALRLGLVGYVLTAFNTSYPAMQFYNLVKPQAAGMVALSMAYSGQLVGIIKQLIGNFSEVEMDLVSIERLQEYAQNYVPEGEEGVVTAKAPAGVSLTPPADWPATGRLELRGVSVAYAEWGVDAPLALREVSITLERDSRVAVVGRTGAGKTTLLKAILQLVPLRSGSIELDGLPLVDVKPSERLRAVGIVPQTAVVFDGTLRFNLDPHGSETDASLWSALVKVGLAQSFMESSPRSSSSSEDGAASPPARRTVAAALSLWLGGASQSEGTQTVELSAGQRQLLGLARAVLCNAKVLLLDEVTAGLDRRAAELVVGALRAQLEGRTSLVVTHQADLLELCKQFLYVDGGRCAWGPAPRRSARVPPNGTAGTA